MKTALAIEQRTYDSGRIQEKANFWKKHMSDFARSGLTKKSYCKKNGVNYGNFFYWIRKLLPPKSSQTVAVGSEINKAQLVPVKLNPTLSNQIESILLCTLNLKNGCAGSKINLACPRVRQLTN